jgi:4-hydroxy-tetrahydrodipicolinate synthase
MKTDKLRGSFVAIVTPFKDGEVDWEGLEKLIEFQIEGGTNVIVPCGTTGESPTLSHDEHDEVIEFTVKKVNGRVPVVAGTGSNSTEEAIRLTKHAEHAGADGSLQVAPYYNKPTQEGLYRHYKAIAEAVSIPLIVYNIPGRSGINIDPPTVARMAEIDNIAGIKEASGSMAQITEVIRLCGPDFIVVSGDDPITYPLICVGGHGVISVVANIIPRENSELCRLALAGQHDEARKLYYRMLPLGRAMFVETNPAPVKAALQMMGMVSDEVRLPLAPLLPASREKLKGVMEEFGLL